MPKSSPQFQDESFYQDVTGENRASTDEIAPLLVKDYIRGDRNAIPGIELREEPGKQIVVEGPKTAAARIEAIIDSGKTDLMSVLSKLEEQAGGHPLRGTGLAITSEIAAIYERFAAVEDLRIVHVTHEAGQSFYGCVFDEMDKDGDIHTYFEALGFSNPIFKVGLDEEEDDQSRLWFTAMDLSGLEDPKYFSDRYGVLPGKSPRIRFYTGEEGEQKLDMVMGEAEKNYEGMQMKVLNDADMQEIIAGSFQKLAKTSGQQARQLTYGVDIDGTFVKTAWDAENDQKTGISLEQIDELIKAGEHTIVVK